MLFFIKKLQLHSQSLHTKLNLLVFQTATSNDSVNAVHVHSALTTMSVNQKTGLKGNSEFCFPETLNVS